MGLAKDDLANLSRYGGVGYSGENVIGVAQIQFGQCRVGVRRGAVHHMQAVIMDLAPKEPHEICIGFERYHHRIRPHPPENLGGERPHTRTIFQKHTSTRPVHLVKNFVHEKARARDQAAEHFRVLDEITSEEQDLLRTRGGLCGHGGGSAFHDRSCRPACRAPGNCRRRPVESIEPSEVTSGTWRYPGWYRWCRTASRRLP